MIPVLRFRPEVTILPAPAGSRILAAFDKATSVLACDLTVTCGSEGHPPTDPHTLGNAMDLSIHALSTDQIVRLVNFLKTTLGSRFTVLYEVPSLPDDATLKGLAYVNPHATGPHIHVQPVRGTVYPPVDPA